MTDLDQLQVDCAACGLGAHGRYPINFTGRYAMVSERLAHALPRLLAVVRAADADEVAREALVREWTTEAVLASTAAHSKYCMARAALREWVVRG